MRVTLYALPVVLLLGSEALAQEDQPPITPAAAPATQVAPPGQRVVPPPTVPDREEPRRLPSPAVPTTPEGSPVVRAAAGNLGMFFRFGGLANLFATGNSRNVTSSSAADALLITQVGIKFVSSENWMIPISIGAGLRLVSQDPGSSRTDWGLDLGAGFEYHFRVWRRISPFLGLNLGLGFSDPSGENNLLFGVGLGPSLGVEYYIGDRLSLSALYQLVFQVAYQQVATAFPTGSGSTTAFSFSTLAGGAMILTYYF